MTYMQNLRALDDGAVQDLRVLDAPAAQQQHAALDPLGEPQTTTFFDAATSRACAWIDCSSPTAMNVTSTDAPP